MGPFFCPFFFSYSPDKVNNSLFLLRINGNLYKNTNIFELRIVDKFKNSYKKRLGKNCPRSSWPGSCDSVKEGRP